MVTTLHCTCRWKGDFHTKSGGGQHSDRSNWWLAGGSQAQRVVHQPSWAQLQWPLKRHQRTASFFSSETKNIKDRRNIWTALLHTNFLFVLMPQEVEGSFHFGLWNPRINQSGTWNVNPFQKAVCLSCSETADFPFWKGTAVLPVRNKRGGGESQSAPFQN